MDGAISDELSVISGVPQGSVLGPLLLLIYIDGVESVTLSDGTIVLYADDMVLYRPIYSYEDYWLLQQDISAIATWIADNHLQFNTSKCKYMTISRKRAKVLPPTINLNGIPLDRVTEFKYLGVLITADLSWTAHINMICTKARRLVGMLYRQFYQDADTTTLKQLYVSNIRPHLEYACQVWDPYLQKDIGMLESVQKFALRVCSKQWDASYSMLCSSLNLPTLAARRKQMKLSVMYKIVHGLACFPNVPISARDNPFNLRSLAPHTLSGFTAKTDSFKYSFFPHSVELWNLLPSDVALANYNSFKNSILNIL